MSIEMADKVVIKFGEDKDNNTEQQVSKFKI